MTISLKKREFGGYETKDGAFRVFNYMGVWTVCFDDECGREDMRDFMTLTEAREFITAEAGA